MTYVAHLIVGYCIAALLALSANLIVGYCGLITLAHAALFGLGAYAYVVALTAWEWPLSATIMLAVGAPGALGLLLARPADRFKGDQFLLVSLVLQVVAFGVIRNWVDSDAPVGSWSNLTNGPYGIGGVPRQTICGLSLNHEWMRSAAAVAMLSAAAGVCFAVLSSPFGRLLKAARDDEWAARTLGKGVSRARRQAFGVAGALAGAAGVLYAVHMTFIDPSIAGIDESVIILGMVIIGGSGNRLLGPLCGAAVFVGIPEILRLLHVRGVDPSNARLLVFGLLLVALIHVRPQGLAGEYRIN